MEKVQCFLCSEEINGNFLHSRQENIILCNILETTHLVNDILQVESTITYCHSCQQRLCNVRDLLENLVTLEGEVLAEKFLIEQQLKRSSENSDKIAAGRQDQNHSAEKFRHDLVIELKHSSMQCMVSKLRKNQVGQRFGTPRKNVRIMKNITCSKIFGTETENKNSGQSLAGSVCSDNSDPSSGQCFIPTENYDQESEPLPIKFCIPMFQERFLSDNIPSVEDSQAVLRFNDHQANSLPLSTKFYNIENMKIEQTCGMLNQEHPEYSGTFEDELPISNFELQSNNVIQVNLSPYVGSGQEQHIPIPTANSTLYLPDITFKFNKNESESASTQDFQDFEYSDPVHTDRILVPYQQLKKSNDSRRRFKLPPSKRPKKCEECGKVLATHLTWRNHVMTLHNDPSRLRHQCTFCGYGSQKLSHVTRHMERIHKIRAHKTTTTERSFEIN